MKITRQVVVFDAPDIDVESTFWAALLGGTVSSQNEWHTVLVDGEPRIDVQHAPNHVRPQWPDGAPQQVHLDLYVDDIEAAHAHALAVGAVLLQAAPTSRCPGFQVYEDPAGHPFCLCWGS